MGKPYSARYLHLLPANSSANLTEYYSSLKCDTLWSGKQVWPVDISEETAASLINVENDERFFPKRRYLCPENTASHRTERRTSV